MKKDFSSFIFQVSSLFERAEINMAKLKRALVCGAGVLEALMEDRKREREL